MFLRRVCSTCSLVALSVTSHACSRPALTPPYPRAPIILLDVDTLRADRMSLYGNTRPTSPAIDEFARRSVVFRWAFAQAPNTPPSQASILSGLYPTTHGRIGNRDVLSGAATTLAEVLQAHGYRTAAFTDGGFMRRGFGLEQGFDSWDDSNKGLRSTEDKIMTWLRDHRDEPFFLLIHTYDVHSPYAPAEPYRSRFLAGTAPPTPGFEPTSEQLEAIRQSAFTDSPRKLPPNDIEYAKALYDGEIAQLDDWFAGFQRSLASLDLLDRSIVVLLSDHGEEFQEHGSVLHEKLYSTVTRVPLVIHFPEQTRGISVDGIVETIDLMPTLLSAVGLPSPSTTQGQDLLSRLEDDLPRRSYAYGQTPDFGEERLMASGDWRLHYRKRTGALELYRFREDPLEQHDFSVEYPSDAAALRDMLLRLDASLRPLSGTPETPAEFDEEAVRQLRALGYLQ